LIEIQDAIIRKKEPNVVVGNLLETIALCETFHAFPNGGGLYDQDPWLMDQFSMILLARKTRWDLDHPEGR
jgi:hypothetical protein